MDSIAPFRYCCSLSLRLLVWWSSISSKNTMRLPQGHKIQMPLWSIDKWSTLSFVRLGLPKHYTRKLRERLLADPIQVQLRLYNERYFLSASVLLNLIETCHAKIQAELRTASRGRTNLQRRNQHAQFIQLLRDEAKEVRRDTLILFTGTRLRCTVDWTMFTSMEADVSHYMERLTETERQLFVAGAGSSKALYEWKNGGSGKRGSSLSKIATTSVSAATVTPRAVSPDGSLEVSVAPKRVRLS